VGYKYAGKDNDVEEPTPITRKSRTNQSVFDPAKCGTYAGYRQHQKHDTPACRDCKDAQAAYSRDYHERRGGRPAPKVLTFNPDACGTYAGWTRHLRSDVKACGPCHRAWLEYRRAWRAARKEVAA